MSRLTCYRMYAALAFSTLIVLAALSSLVFAATAEEPPSLTDGAAQRETQAQAPDYAVLQELRDFDPDIVDVSPASARSYQQVFKDEVLAYCISTAYHESAEVAADALYTAAALHSWSRYELAAMLSQVPPLVSRYLERPYRAASRASDQPEMGAESEQLMPQASSEQAKLQLLKCLDLYHSAELEELAQAHVIDPSRSYAEDHAVIP